MTASPDMSRGVPDVRTRITAGTMLSRGLRKRCPRCGRGKIFKSFWQLLPNCPSCGYAFEREEGYWTGAMIVNIAACMAWFFVLFVGTLAATLPDVNWVPLLIVALITNGLLPIAFYPHSKTIWMAFDLYWHPVRDA
jgi:uncharacterized protein (DUF983 family)